MIFNFGDFTDFCPNCKTRLKAKIGDKETVLGCVKCGYSKNVDDKEKEQKTKGLKNYKKETSDNPIKVMDYVSLGPTIDHECESCGYDKAYLGEIKPTYTNDEQTIHLYKCAKCGKTSRQKTAG